MVLEKKRRNSFTSTAGKKVDIAKAETSTRAQLLAKKKNLRVGDVCNLKITALATNNIGIDEYSFPYAVFVPNAKIGTKIQAKILKIKDASYAVAQLLTLPQGGEEKTDLLVGTLNKDEKLSNPSLREGGKVEAPVKPGEVLTVSIKKQMENGKAGIVEYPNNFRLIIPFVGTNINTETKQLDNVKVTVTRVKENYGFAKMEISSTINQRAVAFPTGNQESGYVRKTNNFSLEVGSKLTTTLKSSCLKSFTKGNGKFVVLNLASLSVDSSFSSLSKEVKEEKKPMVLFLKLKKGGSYYQKLVMNGELRVRIKITSKSSNCVVGKILQINPISKAQKTSLVLNSIGEMINHGMHFGEKVVKCNARMKNYIWSTGLQSNASTPSASLAADKNGKANVGYSKGEMKQGLKKPLIKKGRHVINLLKTRRCLNQALKKVTKYALKGRTFLFIGTKKPAAGLVARASFFTKNSFYVNTRWLGGMLTNWKTICKSISKIRPILKEKQKVVRQILERRQAIKNRLIKKALLLRKKSKLILSKGRLLLETLSSSANKQSVGQTNASTHNFVSSSLHEAKQQTGTETREKLSLLRVASDEFINKGMQYVERRQKLIQKRRDLIYQTVLLKEKAFELGLKHKAILNQLAIYAKKLREYKYLLVLTTEIQKMRSLPSTIEQKEGIHMNLLSVSYGKLKELNLLLKKGKEVAPTGGNDLQNLTETKAKQSYGEDWIIPNPPKEILNRIVICASKAMKTQTVSPTGGTSSLISDKSTSGGANPSSAETNRQEATNGQFIVCSTLLSKFSGFSSYIKSVMKSLMISIQSLETQAKLYSTQLNQIQATLQTYINLKQTYVNELQQLKLNFIKERSMVRIVKRKLKALEAQKKLLKFLPRLRYLPTPQTKISEIVQILLARIVDPKLKYPIENIYNQKLSMSSKKEAAARKKKWQRLEKYFGGIANMTKLNKTQMSRNIAIIIGQNEEMNAVRECQKLGIKMFTVVDTNCNPTFSDHIIPANDDSRSSIKYILTKFITRIRLAQKLRSRLSSYTAK